MPSVNFKKIIHYQSNLPDFIKIHVEKSQDGGYWIKILNLPGCFTQTENAEDLLVMVNDAVYTYFEIPKELIPFLPRYFPSEEIRKKLQEWQKCIPADFLNQDICFFQSVPVSI